MKKLFEENEKQENVFSILNSEGNVLDKTSENLKDSNLYDKMNNYMAELIDNEVLNLFSNKDNLNKEIETSEINGSRNPNIEKLYQA
jgi:hypothetical protein